VFGICFRPVPSSSERVTRIELALSAWEAEQFRLVTGLTWQDGGSALAVADPSSPWLMARYWPGDLVLTWCSPGQFVPCSSPALLGICPTRQSAEEVDRWLVQIGADAGLLGMELLVAAMRAPMKT
jgi:hypothetical protein